MAFVGPACLQRRRHSWALSPCTALCPDNAPVVVRHPRATVTMKQQPGRDKETLAERGSRVYADMEPAQMLYVQVVYIFLVVSLSVVGAANALRLLKYWELYPF